MMKYYSVPLAALLLVLLVLLVLHLGRAPVPLDPANLTTPKTVRTDTARVRKSTATDKRKKVAANSVRRAEKLFGTPSDEAG